MLSSAPANLFFFSLCLSPSLPHERFFSIERGRTLARSLSLSRTHTNTFSWLTHKHILLAHTQPHSLGTHTKTFSWHTHKHIPLAHTQTHSLGTHKHILLAHTQTHSLGREAIRHKVDFLLTHTCVHFLIFDKVQGSAIPMRSGALYHLVHHPRFCCRCAYIGMPAAASTPRQNTAPCQAPDGTEDMHVRARAKADAGRAWFSLGAVSVAWSLPWRRWHAAARQPRVLTGFHSTCARSACT